MVLYQVPSFALLYVSWLIQEMKFPSVLVAEKRKKRREERRVNSIGVRTIGMARYRGPGLGILILVQKIP